MRAGAFAPAFPVWLVVKDFGLIADSAGGKQAHQPVCERVGAIFRQGVDAGPGDLNITGPARLYTAR